MKALDKEAGDVNKAFQEGNAEKIGEVITDAGILVTTAVLTDGITSYCLPAEAVIVADEALVGNSVGAARLGFNKTVEINKLIAQTSETWGNLECVEWATDFSKGLDDLNLPHDFVAIQGEYENLWSNTFNNGEGGVISKNGYHEGVMFSGKVYDNIHTTGAYFEDWINDFVAPYGSKIREVPRRTPAAE